MIFALSDLPVSEAVPHRVVFIKYDPYKYGMSLAIASEFSPTQAVLGSCFTLSQDNPRKDSKSFSVGFTDWQKDSIFLYFLNTWWLMDITSGTTPWHNPCRGRSGKLNLVKQLICFKRSVSTLSGFRTAFSLSSRALSIMDSTVLCWCCRFSRTAVLPVCPSYQF